MSLKHETERQRDGETERTPRRALSFSRSLILSVSLSLAQIGCADPPVPSDTPAQPEAKRAAVSAAELGEALARRIESGAPLTTQHVWKLAQRAAQDSGLTIDLGEPPDNKPLDDTGRKEWTAKFRAWGRH